MDARITFVTLGVDDLERSLRFYRDGLGLPTKGIVGQEFPHGAVVFIDLQAGVKLALWPRVSIAHDTGLPVGPKSSTEFTLAHNVRSKSEVEAVMQQAQRAGAIIVKAAHGTVWGGYAGYFQDPDNHVWEVAWNPALLQPADRLGDRASTLIKDLALTPHPEGGHYAEVLRSDSRVVPSDNRGERRALTLIYYLLTPGDVSRWHQVRSDEVWYFCEGAPIELFVLSHDAREARTCRLGSLADGHEPFTVVRAGEWQAAISTGTYTLVACGVAPGFEFADFQLARDVPVIAAAIANSHPRLASLI